MKYITVISLVLAILIMGLFGGGTQIAQTSESNSFLRIHIRANSNKTVDQVVKYEVKNKVVEALIPVLSECNNKEKAITVIKNNFSLIESVADEVLNNNGFNYTSSAKLNEEYFPTRSYDELVLESGLYDALILELGEGTGNNWWCVVYPPLCFVNSSSSTSNNIRYKSKLLEIIENFFK